MVNISLTTFVDYIAKTGSPKTTCVRNAKRNYLEGDSQGKDFWKPLRDAIKKQHKYGLDITSIVGILKTLADPKKLSNYPKAIGPYCAWATGKSIAVSNLRSTWDFGSLHLLVNPELVLHDQATRYAVKLYFKAEKLSEDKAMTLLHLMARSLPPDARPAVLDVRRSALFRDLRSAPGMDSLLMEEAALFLRLWSEV